MSGGAAFSVQIVNANHADIQKVVADDTGIIVLILSRDFVEDMRRETRTIRASSRSSPSCSK